MSGIARAFRLRAVLLLLLLSATALDAIAQQANSASVAAAANLRYLLADAPPTDIGASVTLLPSGQWLILGGEDSNGHSTRRAHYFDSKTQSTTELPVAMLTPRSGHTATILPSGIVLITGGIDESGGLAAGIEMFDPKSESFARSSSSTPAPRAFATATLLTDGRLLIVGGVDARGRVLDDAEIYEPSSGLNDRFDLRLETARFKHLAALLPSSPIAIWNGLDEANAPITTVELFNPLGHRFESLEATNRGYLPDAEAALAIPVVTGNYPDSRNDIDGTASLTLRFSKPLDVLTLTDKTVTLFGPNGPVPVRIVPAERGLLLFVTSTKPLTPGTTFTLFVNGAADHRGLSLPFTAQSFHTRTLSAPAPIASTPTTPSMGVIDAPSPPPSSMTSSPTGEAGVTPVASAIEPSITSRSPEGSARTPDAEFWIPDEAAIRGNWRTGRVPDSPKLAALAAVEGLDAEPDATALSGQVLRLDGMPLPNVSVSLAGKTTFTDGQGRFLLKELPAGWQRLSVDGATASRPDARYGRQDMRVHITAGKTNPLVWTVWMGKLDTAHAIHLDSPTKAETVLTSPHIPGFAITIPPGTVVRDPDGNIVTEVTVTPVPVDQAPFPLPEGGFPAYFTLQPYGAQFESVTGEPAQVRIRYANFDSTLKVGDTATFWSYDADGDGWQTYAVGTVTSENLIEMSASEHRGISRFKPLGFGGGPPPPPPGPPCPSCCTGGGPPGDGGSGGNGRDGGAPNDPGMNAAGSDEVGDPCSAATGQFTLASSDLSVRDVLGFGVMRVYRPNDTRMLAFGIGTNWPFDIYLTGGTDMPVRYLIMANGSRIAFKNVNGRLNYGGVFVNSSNPGPFFGARMDIPITALENWTVRLRDGTIYTFDYYGNLAEIRSRAGAAISILRPAGNVTQVVSPSGRWISVTRLGVRVTQIQDNGGRTVSYGYDTSGRLTSVTNANGEVWGYTYDTNGRMSTVIDPRHNTMLTNAYDANGRVIRQTYADGSTIQLAYTLDTGGNVTQTDVSDRNGVMRRMQFDVSGYILQDTMALGLPEQQVTTFSRDPSTHLLNSKTDALGRRTDYTYDSSGNTLKVTRLAGTANAATTSYTYEPVFNQPVTITDPLNHTGTFGYDPIGNLTQFTDPLGHSRTMTYDSLGQMLSLTNAVNGMTNYAYDAGVLASITDATSATTTISSDLVGRPTKVTDPLGNATALAYDALDRITGVTDSLGNTVGYQYDGVGNLVAHVDQRGNRTQYAYDSMNRVIARTDALNRNDSYSYDSSSRLSQIVDRQNQVTGYRYDSRHRLTQAGFGATISNPTGYASVIGYTYDAADRLVSASDSTFGTIVRSFDDLDRLMQEGTPDGVVTYTYYGNGLRQTMTVAGQPAINYGYDAGDRLTSITKGSLALTFAYDNADRRTQLTLPNGVTVNYSYDATSRVTGIQYKNGAVALGDLTYGYDGAGRGASMGGTLANVNLPSVGSAAYDANNQVVTWAGNAYAYDLNGNLTSDGTRTYVWNPRGQLSQVVEGGAPAASYTYDAVWRRASKTLGGSTTTLVYDGMNFAQEKQGNSVLASLITGLFPDEVYVRQAASNELFLADAIGSVRAITDMSGLIATTYTYEPYGNSSQSGGASTNTQRFAGREEDLPGFMYYRARYYSSSTGRFVTADHWGIVAGANSYAYAFGNPISYTDPEGEFPLMLGGGLISGGLSFGLQVAINYGASRDLGRSLRCVNLTNVAVSAAIGALGGGLGSIGRNPFAPPAWSGPHGWDNALFKYFYGWLPGGGALKSTLPGWRPFAHDCECAGLELGNALSTFIH